MSSSSSTAQLGNHTAEPADEKTGNLSDSELTTPTATENGSVSDEDGSGGWFAMGADLRTFARRVKSTGEGVAGVIHRGALAIAAEFAELEKDSEQEANRWREENYGTLSQESDLRDFHLPWELRCEPAMSNKELNKELNKEDPSKYYQSEELMNDILALSHDETTFVVPFSVATSVTETDPNDDGALTESRIHLIRRLLDIDENLATIHARLSGRSDVKETVFWKNYFHHCDKLRAEHLSNEQHKFSADEPPKVIPTVSPKRMPVPASESSLDSLIPSGGDSIPTQADDMAYVIASPPTSTNSNLSTYSLGDMVVVGSAEGINLDTQDEEGEELEKVQ